MATALFVVKATIDPDREEEFNRWYDDEHVPDLLRYPGAVSARRYRSLVGEERFQYIAVYEFRDQATLEAFLASDHLKALARDYDARFGGASQRQRFGYLQVYP